MRLAAAIALFRRSTCNVWVKRHWRVGLASALVLGLLIAAWPPVQPPRMHGDSKQYITAKYVGYRLPVYRGLVRVTGTGYPLVLVQTFFAMSCWLFLGWQLGGSLGLAAAGLFGLSFPVYLWNLSVLSESLSFSATALTIGLTLMVARSGKTWAFAAWCVAALLLVFSRESNLALLPFLPAAMIGSRVRRRGRWVMVLLLCLVAAVKIGYSRHFMYYTDKQIRKVVMCHALDHPDARAFFVDHGMPDFVDAYMAADDQGRRALRYGDGALADWMRARGARTYALWLLSHPRSFVDAWSSFLRCLHDDTILTAGRYTHPPPTSEMLTPAFMALGAVPWFIWLAAGALPLLGQRRLGAAAPVAWLVPGLVGASLAQAFLAYHGDYFVDTVRHTFPAVVLHHLALVVAGVLLLQALVVPAARERARRYGVRQKRCTA